MLLFESLTIFGIFFSQKTLFFVFCSLKSLIFCTFDVRESEKFNEGQFFIDMNNIDWKDALGKAFNLPAEGNTDHSESEPLQEKGDAVHQQGKRRLDIILERKGRAGKQATIVTGFVCDDDALKQVASTLKSSLGVGGSARGGEILIQGDFRQRVLDQLQTMGFVARII